MCKTCGEDFPFESQYNTHKLTHSDQRKHACTYTNCEKRFKNLGDRNRHVKEHTSPWLQCPDCPEYKTKAKRDFESHRLKCSKIERYFVSHVVRGSCITPRKYVITSKNSVRKHNLKTVVILCVETTLRRSISSDFVCGNVLFMPLYYMHMHFKYCVWNCYNICFIT